MTATTKPEYNGAESTLDALGVLLPKLALLWGLVVLLPLVPAAIIVFKVPYRAGDFEINRQIETLADNAYLAFCVYSLSVYGLVMSGHLLRKMAAMAQWNRLELDRQERVYAACMDMLRAHIDRNP